MSCPLFPGQKLPHKHSWELRSRLAGGGDRLQSSQLGAACTPAKHTYTGPNLAAGLPPLPPTPMSSARLSPPTFSASFKAHPKYLSLQKVAPSHASQSIFWTSLIPCVSHNTEHVVISVLSLSFFLFFFFAFFCGKMYITKKFPF